MCQGCRLLTTKSSSRRRPRPDQPNSATPHPLVHPQTPRLTALPARSQHRHRLGSVTHPADPARDHLPTHQDLKESPDPDFEAKLEGSEYALTQRPERIVAFDGFGPLGLRPTAGTGWAPAGEPDRLPATYHRTHGMRYFHGCHSVGDDLLWGVNHRRKGIDHTWAALRSIRAARPDDAPIYVILDNLAAHKNARILVWAKKNKVVESCCCSPRPTPPLESTRSRRTSGPCASSPWPTPTIPATPCRPPHCTPTCAGATLTLVVPTCWPRNDADAPASAARKASAGVAERWHPPHDHPPGTLATLKERTVRTSCRSCRRITRC